MQETQPESHLEKINRLEQNLYRLIEKYENLQK